MSGKVQANFENALKRGDLLVHQEIIFLPL